MSLNRTPISIGSDTTVPNTTWENEFKNKINNILENVADLTLTAGFINGLIMEYISSNLFRVNIGICFNNYNTELIEVTKSFDVNVKSNGAGGLDIGTLANGMYYVWLIKHEFTKEPSAIISLSDTSPILPKFYQAKRLIGAINISSLSLYAFTQMGNSNRRDFIYFSKQTVVSNAQPAFGTWTTASASSFVPNSATYSRIGFFEVNMRGANSGLSTASGLVFGYLRHGSSTDATGTLQTYVRYPTTSVEGDASATGWLKIDSSGNISYKRDVGTASSASPFINVFCLGFRMNV